MTAVILLCLLFMTTVSAGKMSLTIHGITDTLSPENAKYAKALEAAGQAFEEVEALFNEKAYAERKGWKKDKSNDEGDVVYAKDTPKGKMVTISTVLPGNVDFVMKETWDGVADLPQWNKNINYASTIASPTDNFDIITYGNNDVLVVSGRDFVSARIYRKLPDGGYIMASKSVDLPEYPETDGKVRAELILAGARFRPHPEYSHKTLTDVVMLADLKGMLPKLVVNQVIGKIMLMDTVTNREHFGKLVDKEQL